MSRLNYVLGKVILHYLLMSNKSEPVHSHFVGFVTRRLLCGVRHDAVLGVFVHCLFDTLDGMWNSIVLVPDNCLFIYF